MKTIADALFGQARQSVLGILFSKPEVSIHPREVARMCGLSAPMVARELASLAEAGILTARRDGNRVQYQANDKCPIFEELRGIARKTSGVADVIRNALGGLDIDQAFIFGSIASGKDHADSDVDLLVVSELSSMAIYAALDGAEQQLRRNIHLTHYDKAEFEMAKNEPVIESIIKSKKIMVAGHG